MVMTSSVHKILTFDGTLPSGFSSGVSSTKVRPRFSPRATGVASNGGDEAGNDEPMDEDAGNDEESKDEEAGNDEESSRAATCKYIDHFMKPGTRNPATSDRLYSFNCEYEAAMS